MVSMGFWVGFLSGAGRVLAFGFWVFVPFFKRFGGLVFLCFGYFYLVSFQVGVGRGEFFAVAGRFCSLFQRRFCSGLFSQSS